MNINKVIVVGYLTANPMVKVHSDAFTTANFSVATNRKWKDKDGSPVEEAEFHNITAFNKQAELIEQYVFKGDQLGIEGRLKTDRWTDKDTGKERYKTGIIAERIHFGRKAEKTGQEQPHAPASAAPAAPAHDPQQLQDDIDSIF